MTPCEHSLGICTDCEGLVVTEWTPIGMVGDIQVFIAPVAEPCDQVDPQPPTA